MDISRIGYYYASYCGAFAAARSGASITPHVGMSTTTTDVVAAAMGVEDGKAHESLVDIGKFKERLQQLVGNNWKYE